MRLSLGFNGPDGDEPEYIDALKKVVGLSKKYGLVSGIFSAGPVALKKHLGLSFDYSMASSDTGALTSGLKMGLDASREAVKVAKL